jgi:hypothetical protein
VRRDLSPLGHCATWKSTPNPCSGPPLNVVPYTFPSASTVTGAMGSQPFRQLLKVYSVVSVTMNPFALERYLREWQPGADRRPALFPQTSPPSEISYASPRRRGPLHRRNQIFHCEWPLHSSLRRSVSHLHRSELRRTVSSHTSQAESIDLAQQAGVIPRMNARIGATVGGIGFAVIGAMVGSGGCPWRARVSYCRLVG